jgi:hypothetical protein
VEDIDEAHDEGMNRYCHVSAPLHLVKACEESDSPHWRRWLTDGASDDQLLEFLYWNYDAMLAMQNDRDVQAEIGRQKADYKVEVARGIEEGWLHPDAANAIDEVDGVSIYIGDPFDTYFQDRLGYYIPGADWVVVAGERFKATWRSGVLAQLKNISRHEINHAVLGRFAFWWMSEAATEHIAQSLEHGQPDRLHPHTRDKISVIYDTTRMLMDHLLSTGQIKIPVREMTRAYSSETASDRMEFEAKLDSSWSHIARDDHSAMQSVDNFIRQRQEKLAKEGMRELVARHEAINNTYDILRFAPRRIFSHDYGGLSVNKLLEQIATSSNESIASNLPKGQAT